MALVIMAAAPVSAATSSTLNFQGRLLTSTGGLVPDGSYDIEYKIYDDALAGTNLWTETHTVGGGNAITVRNGYFSVYLGDATTGNPFPNTIPWDQNLWMTMNVNSDGEMSPRFKLTAVPYAFRAGALVDSTGAAKTADDFAQLAPANVQAVNSALAALRLNQTGSGALLQLQGNGSDVFTIDKLGNTVAFGALDVKGASVNVGTTTQSGSLVLSDGTSNKVTINSSGVTTDYALTLPAGVGAVGQCLKNDATIPGLLVFDSCAIGSGITSLNGQLNAIQSFATGTTGTDFGISSSGGVHTFNLPDASAANRGLVTNAAQTFGGLKTFSAGLTVTTGQNLTVNGEAFQDLTGNGLTFSGNALNVIYGSTANTAVQGDTSLTCASGTGNLTGGGTSVTLGAGGTCGAISTNSAVSFTTSVTSPLITNAGGLNIRTTGANALTLGTDGTTRLTINSVGAATFTSSVAATSFSGSGAGLTNITATNISGIIADGNLSSNVALLTGTQTFTGLKTFGAGLTVTNGQNFTVGGQTFTGLTGNGLTFSSNTLNVAYGSTANTAVQGNTSLTCASGTGNLTGGGTSITLGAGGSCGSISIINNPTFSGLITGQAGLTVTTGQNLTVNGESFQDLTGNGLTFSGNALNVIYGSTANTAVQGNISLTCAAGAGNLTGGGISITLGTGGSCGSISITNAPTFTTSVTSPTFTGTGAVTLSSGGAGNLTLTSASGVTVLGNTTQRRLGGLTYELNNAAADTTFAITNTDATYNANLTVEGKIGINNVALNNKFNLNTPTTTVNTTEAVIATTSATQKGLVIQGSVGQSALLFELQNSAGTPLSGFNASGGLVLGLTTLSSTATVSRSISLPDAAGTVCLSNTDACGFWRLASGTIQTDATANNTIDINKTNATGNLILLKRATTPVFTVANTGSLQIQSTSTTALDIRNVGGSSFFSVDSSTGIVRVGPTTADAIGVLFVLDTKNNAGDPTGVNGGLYYNSATEKFRCFEGGVWVDCLGRQVRSFVDTVANNLVASNNTTNYWNTGAENNNSFPNLTPTSTSRSISGSVSFQVNSTTSQDRMSIGRVERNIGSAVTCGSGTVVGFYLSSFTTNSGETASSTITFVDSPATTSQVFYTVCSDTASSGTSITVDKIRVTLEETTNTN